MAAFIEGVLRAWPDQRILVVTHVRELIAQNYAELIGLWRDAPAGIYSAGLGRRDLGARILFAGIQSIHRRAYDVQQCDLVLIDEAHLIPGASDTMYRRFLDTLARINPQLKVIGFTATPYRLDSGMLHEGKGALFTDIAYEVSVRQLIDDGYLCPLVSKAAETKLDVSRRRQPRRRVHPRPAAGGGRPARDHRGGDRRGGAARRRPAQLARLLRRRRACHPRRRGDPRARLLAPPRSSATPRSPSATAPSPPSSAARSGRSPRWAC